MPIATADDLLAALGQSDLLTADQLQKLTEWSAATKPDAMTLAKEIIRREWLTQYQIREILRDRGAELRVDKYILQDLIGEGGMGRVYKAQDQRLHRTVALKVIRKEKLSNPLNVRRFHNEIRAVSQLAHPHVVLAFDAGEIHGNHYCAMEFVDGTDLTRHVRSHGRLDIREACEYIRQAALGLNHAHERGLVHRDIKPSNLMLARNGQVKVLDLGLAMLNEAASEQDGRLTQDNLVIGTPDFLAPEQAKNAQTVDIRADVYALGATLYYLLTARVPYSGSNATEKLIKHVSDPPPSLLKHRPDAPPALDALIQWMMAKRPEDRPQTPMQVAAALHPFAMGTPPAGPYAGPHPGHPGFPAPPPGFPPLGNQEFVLPPSETPARVRERSTQTRSKNPLWIVSTIALLGLIVGGYFIVRSQQNAGSASLPDRYTVPSANIRMILIPAGQFTMGSPDGEPGRKNDEGPAHAVTISQPFYMSVTEVTHGQYLEVMGRSPSVLAAKASTKVANDLPVDSVTWSEAIAFCAKLSERDRGRRIGWEYRLPTEAEWEYACRGGTTEPFASGNRLIPEEAAFFTPSPEDEFSTHELARPPILPSRVGITRANAFGLHDMHGNVWEWCMDWFHRSYPEGPRTDPRGPAEGDLRVVRGGAFNESGARCRSAARRSLAPNQRETNVGFRIVFAPISQ